MESSKNLQTSNCKKKWKRKEKKERKNQNTDEKNRRYKASGLNRKKKKHWTLVVNFTNNIFKNILLFAIACWYRHQWWFYEKEICKDKSLYGNTDVLYKVAGSEENISNSLGLNIDRRVIKTEPNMKSWFMIICMWIMI